jgi:transcriptional regulator with XRE-family HTH domain
MLAAAKVEEAKRLMIEGKLSQRKVAKLLGMSRATVSAIASGKRPDYEARRLALAVDEEPSGPIERCPTCGGRVYMPCRLCRVRRLKAREDRIGKLLRRRARTHAIERLLDAVARAAGRDHLAPADAHFESAAAPPPSDCK